MNQKLSGKFALVILAIVIVAGLALVVLNKRAPAVPPAGPAVAPQPVLTSAPKGETIAEFPKELILDKAAEVGSSYSLSYNANLNQYSASYVSKIAMGELFDMYKSYYQKNGWTIVNETKYSASRGLYAIQGALESSAGIFDEGKTRNVIVNYLKK
jgi:hypothetical protein